MDYALNCASYLTAEADFTLKNAIVNIIWSDLLNGLPEIAKGLTLSFVSRSSSDAYSLLSYDQKQYRYVMLKSLRDYGAQWGEFVYTTLMRLFMYLDVDSEYRNDWYEHIKEKILRFLDTVCLAPYSLYTSAEDAVEVGSVRDWSEAVYNKLIESIINIPEENRSRLQRDMMMEHDMRRLLSDMSALVSFAMDSAIDHLFDGTDAMLQSVASDLGLLLTEKSRLQESWRVLNDKFKNYLIESKALALSKFPCSSMWVNSNSKFVIQRYSNLLFSVTCPSKQGYYVTEDQFNVLSRKNILLKGMLNNYPTFQKKFLLLTSHCVYTYTNLEKLKEHFKVIADRAEMSREARELTSEKLKQTVNTTGEVYFALTTLRDNQNTHMTLESYIRKNIHDYVMVHRIIRELYQLLLHSTTNMDLSFNPDFRMILVVKPTQGDLHVAVPLECIRDVSKKSYHHFIFALHMCLYWQYTGKPTVQQLLQRLIFVNKNKFVGWNVVYRALPDEIRNSYELGKYRKKVWKAIKQYDIYVNGAFFVNNQDLS